MKNKILFAKVRQTHDSFVIIYRLAICQRKNPPLYFSFKPRNRYTYIKKQTTQLCEFYNLHYSQNLVCTRQIKISIYINIVHSVYCIWPPCQTLTQNLKSQQLTTHRILHSAFTKKIYLKCKKKRFARSIF